MPELTEAQLYDLGNRGNRSAELQKQIKELEKEVKDLKKKLKAHIKEKK